MKTKPFTAAQLEALRSQRLNGLAKRLLDSLETAMADRGRLAGELEQLRANLGELERARPDREKVLVIIEGDGTVRVHADGWVDAKVVNLAAVDPANDRLMDLAEEIAAYQLPGVYRDLWERCPKPRAVGSVRDCRRPAELYSHSLRLEVHAIADRLLKKAEARK